jgi:hypothetical protein
MSPIEDCEGEQFSKSGQSIDPGLDRPHLHGHQEPLSHNHCLMIPGQRGQTQPVIHMDEFESRLSVSDVGTFEEFSPEIDSKGGLFAKIITIDSESVDNIEIYNKSIPPRNRSLHHSPSLPEPLTNNELSLDGEFPSGRTPEKSSYHKSNLSMVTTPMEIPKLSRVHPIMLINNQDMINLNAQPIENKNFKKNLEPLTVNCTSNDSSDEFRGIPDIADGGRTEEMENYYERNYYDSNGMNELYKKDLDSKETVVQTI